MRRGVARAAAVAAAVAVAVAVAVAAAVSGRELLQTSCFHPPPQPSPPLPSPPPHRRPPLSPPPRPLRRWAAWAAAAVAVAVAVAAVVAVAVAVSGRHLIWCPLYRHPHRRRCPLCRHPHRRRCPLCRHPHRRRCPLCRRPHRRDRSGQAEGGARQLASPASRCVLKRWKLAALPGTASSATPHRLPLGPSPSRGMRALRTLRTLRTVRALRDLRTFGPPLTRRLPARPPTLVGLRKRDLISGRI